MLAFIIGFLSVFAIHPDLTGEPNKTPYDSVKRPGKPKLSTDTTGRFVEINRIFIIGNRITRDQIVLRELSLKPGDIVYNLDLPSLFDLDKKKLINTRLFNKLEIRTFTPRGIEGVLVVPQKPSLLKLCCH